jgi:diacylglycerol kinase
MVNFKKLIASFKFALSGIKIIFREEHSFRIMFFIALLVAIAMFYFDLPMTQKAILFMIIMFVLVLELMNSAMEKFLDFTHPDGNHRIKIIKDVLAGIVLIACIGAAVIGILIFWPYFLSN